MTTSTHQRKMYKISPNNPVRRRLNFGDSPNDQAKEDNFANILQESITRDVKEKSKKWNFDFKKEEALKGRFEWYKIDGDDWIIMTPSDDERNPRHDNENTPVHDNTGFVKPIRKRRVNIERICNESVKRRVKFD